MAYNYTFLTREQPNQNPFYQRRVKKWIVFCWRPKNGRIKKIHRICTGIFFPFILQDWDKPEHIPDPDAKKPEDWDEEMDGEWEPPVIQNPEYKVIIV